MSALSRLAEAAGLAANGRHDDAIAVYDELLREQPANAELHFNRAMLIYRSGAADLAERGFLNAGALRPRWSAPPLALGQLYFERQRFVEAEHCLRVATALEPNAIAAHCNLGLTLTRLARTPEALASFRRARELHPADEGLWVLLRNALLNCGRDQEALEDFLRFEAQAPLSARMVAVGLAASRLMPGDAYEQKYLRLALDWAFTVGDLPVMGSILSGIQYHDVAQEDILRIYQNYDTLMQSLREGRPVAVSDAPASVARDTSPLKVGYLSANFCNHVMGWTMLEVLSRHDPRQFAAYAYSIGQPEHEDAYTQAFRDRTRRFVRLSDCDDGTAAQRIASDRLDVLVDLMSHSAGARPGILVHKPAPVIVEHLGLHGALGLRQVDFKITDAVADLEDAAQWQIERPLRMHGSVLPVRRVDNLPAHAVPPARPEGAVVVFGAFASLQKLSPRCLRTWRRILDRVDGSVLLFSPWQVRDREFYVRRAESFGIDGSRLRFLPATQKEAVDRARYQVIDIALDAFPYTGGDSAAAALAQGVPLVTLCGRRHAERVATSILTQLGVTDTIAGSEEDYVEIATALALDASRRAELSARIRACLPWDTASAMETYTRNFEDALQRAVRPGG